VSQAHNNPFGVPYWAAGLVVIGGGTAWAVSRMRVRRKLTELLVASPVVMTALKGGYIDWLPEDRAKEVITFTNATNAEVGYALILAEVRAVLPAEKELQIGFDVQRAIEEKLTEMGLDPETIEKAKNEAADLYQMLPNVPLIDTSKWLPDWITGNTTVPEEGT